MKPSRVFDYIITRAVLFFVSFVWVRYYLDSLLASLFVALGITVGLAAVYDAVTFKKRRKKALSKKEKEHRDSVVAQLIYGGREAASEFFWHALPKKFDACLNKGWLCLNDGTVVVPFFTAGKLNERDVADICALLPTPAHKLIILTANASNAAREEAERAPLPALIYEQDKVYKLLKGYGKFPELVNIPKKAKKRKNILLFFRALIDRRLSKTYFLCGLWLIITGLFFDYTLYYMTFATALFILSIVCLFKPSISADKDLSLE